MNSTGLDIVSQATMAMTIVKMLVDLIKLAWGGEEGHPPTWLPPIAALVIGILVMVLLAQTTGQDLTGSQALAQTILSGLMAGAGSIGVTELHKLARAPVLAPVTSFLDAEPAWPAPSGPSAMWRSRPEVRGDFEAPGVPSIQRPEVRGDFKAPGVPSTQRPEVRGDPEAQRSL